MDYCEKNMFVREALLANPHKYGESDKQPLREHVMECEVCQESVNEAEQFAKGMGHDLEC